MHCRLSTYLGEIAEKFFLSQKRSLHDPSVANGRYCARLSSGLVLVGDQDARDVEFGTAHDLQRLANEGEILIERGPARAIRLDVLILKYVVLIGKRRFVLRTLYSPVQ